ncbi:hypothetical protein [Hoyosella subflava]|uniref:Uncharacterized protein n=1 Tax=Hoyosella subflava (strain DSM 45089 / JCM 17490 / NBRC 109087 / DQS3-9A1) TaxID=443218 RepID=F6EJ67_HOYSD|nr:hypothetical protein [Hoyosella subflava]AEF41299.1 hypothetical protein AS9A_2852 [Hoyosella subflava DQS3-9A1]
MKTLIRTSAVSAILASSILLTGPLANAQDLSSTLSIGSIELMSNLPYYGYSPYYWGYGYGYVPQVFDLGGLAIGEGAGIARDAITTIPQLLPW